MEIKEPTFTSVVNDFHTLSYWADEKFQSVIFDDSTLTEMLIGSGLVKDYDGTLVTIALLSESDEPSTETYTLDEFLPMMSNASWKDVATFIENSKKD